MRRQWRGGLIGCGFFAANQMNAWQQFRGVKIVALCDINRLKAEAMGRQFGIENVYDDPATMLASEELDFIDIATTVESHRALVELGALRGAFTICQKPLAANLEDADAMVDACERAHVQLVVHENFRWQRPFLRISERIASGAIGAPRSLRLIFRHAFDIYRGQPYLLKAERLALMDVGMHLFDVARFLIGDVASVGCQTQRLNPAVRGEDAFIAALTHDNGAITTIDCSFFDHDAGDVFPQTLARVEGTGGTIELLRGYELREQSHDACTESNLEPPVTAWGEKPWHCIQDSVINFQQHIVDVLDGFAQPSPSGAHNRNTLALVLAAYESAATGREVSLPICREQV